MNVGYSIYAPTLTSSVSEYLSRRSVTIQAQNSASLSRFVHDLSAVGLRDILVTDLCVFYGYMNKLPATQRPSVIGYTCEVASR